MALQHSSANTAASSAADQKAHRKNQQQALKLAMTELLIFLLGLIVGHRLTLSLDHRKEFNAAAEPIRAYLLRCIEFPWQDPPWPTPLQMDAFVHCLRPWQRSGFRDAWDTVQHEREKAASQDACGGIVYRESDARMTALRTALKYTGRR